MLVSIANLVPCQNDLDAAICAVCGESMPLDPRGNFLIDLPGPSFLCDACGRRERPGLWEYLCKLREAVRYVPTIGGASLADDPFALHCPACGDPVGVEPGWHLVDVVHGRPLCDECVLDADPAVVKLCHILSALQRAEVLARWEVSRCT